MSLSSLIVQREIATIREVEEALARQVLYGGDLVTNLFEVTHLPEAKVTPILAESFGLPAAPLGELPTPLDGTRKLVPVEIASARGMMPLGKNGTRLLVAVSEPLAKDIEQELSSALGMVLEQRIAPSFRIREAIAREYGVPLERRVQRLLGRLVGDDNRVPMTSLPPLLRDPPRAPTPYPPPARHVTPTPPPTNAGPSLKKTLGGFVSIAQPATVEPAPQTTQGLGEGIPVAAEPLPAAPPEPAPVAAPAMPPAEVQRPNVITKMSGDLPMFEPPADAGQDKPSPAARSTLQRTGPVVSPSRVRRRRGPLTPDTALEELEEASDRDTILNLFFDFARQYFDYSVLFIVQSDLAEGRDAFGDGAGRERVVTIGVPLDMPSILSRARDKAAPLLALPVADGLDKILMADLERSIRGPALVVPIVVRARVVALLYGDSGDAGVDKDAAREVETFALATGQAFERVIVRKKRQKGAPPASSPPAAKSEPAEKPEPKKSPSNAPGVELSPRARSIPAPTSAEPAVIELSPIQAATIGTGEVPAGNLFQVRRPSGRPIPREEPDRMSEERIEPSVGAPSAPPNTVDVRGELHRKREVDPSILSHAVIVGATVSAGVPAPEITHTELEYPEPTEKDTIVLEVEAPPAGRSGATAASSPESPPEEAAPASQAICIPAHLPPSSRKEPTDVPSIIVDVGEELVALVERFLGSNDEQAEAELLRQGMAAMPAIMVRFPGPITADVERISSLLKGTSEKTPAIRVTECGPLLRLIAGQRRVALPFVLEEISQRDPERRFWATFLLTELVYAESAGKLVERLFDDEPRTRKVARLAARALAEVTPGAIIQPLGDLAFTSSAPAQKRVTAIELLGDLREPAAIPVLVSLLGDSEPKVAEAAHEACVTVTRQDYGNESRKWLGWWSAHASQHRIEWLIDALMHEDARLRHAAGEELKSITKEYFGYYGDLPKRERERAQQRYRDWWSTEGRIRFRRS